MSQADLTPDIVQLFLPEQGRSQSQRLPLGLTSDYVNIDERTESQLFDLLKTLASGLRFYADNAQTPSGNWDSFFPFDYGASEAWLASNEAKISPHLSLLKVFLEQYLKRPVQQQNNLKQAYVDFYYETVLGFSRKPMETASAYLLLELKKGAANTLVTEEHRFIAGKREDGSTAFAQATFDTIINHSAVAELRTVYSDNTGLPFVKIAPIADSIDGLGEEFPEGEKAWSAFGHSALQSAEIGFAISSPLFQLKEGERQITVDITFSASISSSSTSLPNVFKVFLSTKKGWTESQFATATLLRDKLTLEVDVGAGEAPIIGYSPDLHGFELDTSSPVIQCLIDADASNSLLDELYAAFVKNIALSVEVNGATSLNIHSDLGLVSSDNPFFPFGSVPKKGSQLKISSEEIFAKRIKSITAKLSWKKAPNSFSSLYAGYHDYEAVVPAIVTNFYFTANASLVDGAKRRVTKNNQALFNTHDASQSRSITINETGTSVFNQGGYLAFTKLLAGHQSSWARREHTKLSLISPLYSLGAVSSISSSQNSADSKDGALTLTLNRSFFHEEYRKAYVKSVIAAGTDPEAVLVNEPYTPELANVSVDYSAYIPAVTIATASPQAFANDELRFFHLDCFGQRREHAYQRQQLAYVNDQRVSLLPQHKETGSFYIGLSNLQAGDSCQLLFKVLEGSANPSLEPAQITWSILCDNYFKTLDEKSLVFDHTNHLQTSGLVRIVIPREATQQHTLLPSGLIWVKLSISGSPESLCKLEEVLTNAIEVKVSKLGADEESFMALPSGSISKQEKPLASIKKVQQPYAGFGGANKESTDDFSARVASRLRHKDRSITVWDYESLILENFRHIHRVKTLPHAKPGKWTAPGNVTILLVPYVDKTSSAEPLTPRVSTNTLQSVEAFLLPRSGMQVKHHVINPEYVHVRMHFQVRFKTGFEFNFYRAQLDQALLLLFSPWLNTADEPENGTAQNSLLSPNFGGRVYKSVIMDFIEELPYVDFVTQVVMQASSDGLNYGDDVNELRPMSPDQIITSAFEHIITQTTELADE